VTFVILFGAVAGCRRRRLVVLAGVLAVPISLGLCVRLRAPVTALSESRGRAAGDLGVLLGGLVVIAFFAANMVFQQSLVCSEAPRRSAGRPARHRIRVNCLVAR
jgi:hypothetical protein